MSSRASGDRIISYRIWPDCSQNPTDGKSRPLDAFDANYPNA